MSFDFLHRTRKDDRITEPEPLRDPKQPFQERNAEEHNERAGNIGQDD